MDNNKLYRTVQKFLICFTGLPDFYAKLFREDSILAFSKVIRLQNMEHVRMQIEYGLCPQCLRQNVIEDSLPQRIICSENTCSDSLGVKVEPLDKG
jgi:hypothetical protein